MSDSGLLFLPESSKLKSPKGDVLLFMGWRILKPGKYVMGHEEHFVAFERLILFCGTRAGFYIMKVATGVPVESLIFDIPKPTASFFKRLLGAFLSIHALKNLKVVKVSGEKATRATHWSLPEKRTPCGHLRSAHWHNYRCGPGKQHVKTLWFEDMPVNGFEEIMA